MEQQVDSFYAKSEDGRIYRVVEYEKLIQFNALNSVNRRFSGGARRLALEDGRDVKPVNDDEYEIDDSEERIFRIR